MKNDKKTARGGQKIMENLLIARLVRREEVKKQQESSRKKKVKKDGKIVRRGGEMIREYSKIY